MNPQEASLRPLYNNDVKAILNQIQTSGGLDYETAVANLVSKYGGAISPQEIGDTLYGIYSDVLGAPSARYYGVSTTGGGGTGGAPQFNLTDKISALNDLYNLIYQDLGTMTQEQRKQIEQGFGRQAESQKTQYEQGARQLPLQYGARGIGNSSYYAEAAGSLSDAYNQSLKDIQAQQESKLGELGRAYETQRAGLQAQQAQLGGLPKYGSQADVSALESQLGSLTQQRAGLGTQAGYLGALQNIAPTPTTSASQLETKLQELAGQSVPSFAKQTIGQGQIKQSGLTPEQQTYYTDYFDKLLKQGTAGTSGA